MADPLSSTPSVLGILTAAAQTTDALYETVKHFEGHNKTLGRLQDELKDMCIVLDSLTKMTQIDTQSLALLEGPLGGYSQLCRAFERSMKSFRGKSRTRFPDWAKMEFMGGNISEFIHSISGYKSTVLVFIGSINLYLFALPCLFPSLLTSFH
jgi:hypothetical protein